MICKMHFDMFFWNFAFCLKKGFCRGYKLCMTAEFQNVLISRIFGAFSSVFFFAEQL